MPAKLERRSERQGGVNTKKIRAVCVNCNNRWMSSLESKVKPTLLDLFGSHDGELTPEAAQTLALWIAVKSIVAEHAAPGTTLTPASDRNAVFRTHAIPNYFQIYIGYHTLQTQAAYHRQSTTVSLSLRGPDPPLTLECTRNIQATLFLVGPLCIYLAAARVAGFDFTTLAPPYPMLMLFSAGTTGNKTSILPSAWNNRNVYGWKVVGSTYRPSQYKVWGPTSTADEQCNLTIRSSAPCQGAVFPRVQIPSGNFRSSR